MFDVRFSVLIPLLPAAILGVFLHWQSWIVAVVQFFLQTKTGFEITKGEFKDRNNPGIKKDENLHVALRL